MSEHVVTLRITVTLTDEAERYRGDLDFTSDFPEYVADVLNSDLGSLGTAQVRLAIG